MSVAEKRIREMTRPSVAMMMVTMIAGAIAGATTGIIAGPLGFAIGAAIGASIGVAAGLTIQFVESIILRHERRLDREIGIDGGDIGGGPALTRLRQLEEDERRQLFR
jgi:hypothetical protein